MEYWEIAGQIFPWVGGLGLLFFGLFTMREAMMIVGMGFLILSVFH